MTPTRTVNTIAYEIPPHICLAIDPDRLDPRQSQKFSSDSKTTTQDDKTTSSREARHWRVQFLRHSARVSTARGIAGLTPPFCPLGPTLSRPLYEDIEEYPESPPVRRLSPLRNISQNDEHPPEVRIKYSSSISVDIQGMPHAVSIAHSGFQALILCGPGIGLSTFTNVPSEHPKALINVANRPMVWYVLDWCYRMGVTDITLVTPPPAKDALAAALGQNPYLTSLPSPSPDLLAPKDLEFTTPTSELLRLPEVQKVIKSDFLLLPCDLVCDISGISFLETYLTTQSGVGGVGSLSEASYGTPSSKFSLGGEGSGRRGGLSIWYNTANRTESVKGEECDFMATTQLDARNGTPLQRRLGDNNINLRKLVSTMPMSELWDTVEEDKAWKVRQSLLRKYGAVKCMTKFRDSHIYFFPYWVKEFAALNEDFESVSEDLVGTWANAEWRKPSYRARYGVQKIFTTKKSRPESSQGTNQQIENEIDLLSLSSTQVTRHIPNSTPYSKQTAQLASRVQASADSRTISPDHDEDDDLPDPSSVPIVPPFLSCLLSADPSAPLVRRVDTTPLLLSVSLVLAQIPTVEETGMGKSTASPLAHAARVAGTATIAPRVTISRNDTLIDSNTSIATQCVIKSSCIGSAVSVGTGSRITGCVIMDGATIGDKCVLTNTVIGKKAKIGKGCTLQNCEVQDGNAVSDGTEGKSEKYLVGGLEDDMDEDDFGDEGDANAEEGEGISLGV